MRDMIARFQFAMVIFNNAITCNMQFLCKRKISTHSSTPLHGYPTIRLPREFKALIGETARIYLREETDKLAFEVIIDKKVGKICTISEDSNLEDRINDLESQVRDLKSSFLNNGSPMVNCNKKGAQLNGLGRIRTGDLRRVKAPFRNWSPC